MLGFRAARSDWLAGHGRNSVMLRSAYCLSYSLIERDLPTLFNFRVDKQAWSNLQYQRRGASSVARHQTQALAKAYPTERLLQFRYDLSDGNASTIRRYENYITDLPLEPQDTLQLVRQLHKGIWSDGLLAMRNVKSAESLQTLLDHYYAGRLPASAGATTVLLSICRDRGAYADGVKLWQWAEDQGPPVVTLATYGAAIELFLAAGQDLFACEQIFQRGMETLSQGFNRYLMTPNAILSSPERKIAAVGVSTSLLSSMAHARLKHGNWLDGYLAIDSALKLRPDRLPPRMMLSILDNRPLEEALRLFRVICLGGSKVSEFAILRMFQRLRDTQEEDLRSSHDRYHKVFIASLAQIDLIHNIAATGQAMPEALANTILTGMLVNLPNNHRISDASVKEQFTGFAKLLKDTITKMFVAVGKPPSKLEVTMLKAAAKLQDQKLFENSLEEINELRVRLHPQQHPVVFKLALSFGDADLLEKVARTLGLSSERAVLERTVRGLPAQCKSQAEVDAYRAFHLKFFLGTAPNEDGAVLSPRDVSRRTNKSHNPRNEIGSSPNAKPDAVLGSRVLERQENRLNKLIDRLDHLSNMIEKSAVRNITEHPLPPISLHRALGNIPESWQRDLYGEIHLDPLSRRKPYQKAYMDKSDATNAASTVVFSLPTGVSYEEARFQIFSGINEIMLLAWGSESLSKESRKGDMRTYTEMLEALDSSRAMLFDSDEEWQDRMKIIRSTQQPGDPTGESQTSIRDKF